MKITTLILSDGAFERWGVGPWDVGDRKCFARLRGRSPEENRLRAGSSSIMTLLYKYFHVLLLLFFLITSFNIHEIK